MLPICCTTSIGTWIWGKRTRKGTDLLPHRTRISTRRSEEGVERLLHAEALAGEEVLERRHLPDGQIVVAHDVLVQLQQTRGRNQENIKNILIIISRADWRWPRQPIRTGVCQSKVERSRSTDVVRVFFCSKWPHSIFHKCNPQHGHNMQQRGQCGNKNNI